MTKRSTEDVLRAEVAIAAKAVDRAVAELAKANIAKTEAEKVASARAVGVHEARETHRRATAALEAFLPTPIEAAVDAVKERQKTTGTHDPADLDQAEEGQP